MQNLTGVRELSGSTIEDFKAPLFVAWQITSSCNLGCLHCCEESGHSFPDEMEGEVILNFCWEIVKMEIPYVALSGGEPLLHPDFFKICEFLRSKDIDIKVETNGDFIDMDVARGFAKLGARSVQVSVDGATASTHQRLRLRGSWDKAINACRYLIEEGVNTEIVFVPTKFNIHEIGEAIDLADLLGVYGFYTGKIMRIGRAAQNWSMLEPSPEEYENFFNVLKAKAVEYEGKMKVYYYPYDVIEELKYRLECPAASLLVLPDGKVKLIGPLPFVCGDVKRQSLEEIWSRYKKAWRKPEVIEYARRVIDNPLLLAEANRWIEIY